MTVRGLAVPKWGLSMTTGKILAWLVSEGTEVEEGTELAEIDTDKINGVLESPWPGVVRRIVAPVGATVPVGAVIAVIAPAGAAEEEVERMAAGARERLASGIVPEESGTAFGTVEADGRQICYATLGEGPEVIVLVHGYGGDKGSWLFVQEPLARRHTVHALDLPGHGGSGKRVEDFGSLTGAVAGFLDAIGAPPAHLVGHSLGGAVVTAVAAARPGRVRSLTLVAPAGFGTEIDAGYVRSFAAASSRRELRPQLGKLFADPGQVTGRLVDDLLRYKRLDGVAEALKTVSESMLDGDRQAIDVTTLHAGLAVPTVVVWGGSDRILPYGEAGRPPGVRLVDGAGHMVHMEAPAAVVAAVEEAVEAGGS
ncbi:acetoin dehydrogenase dihydrolipoyllysine-residue acetyltransferase subunit [Planobispora takensis]|uniref:Branched-chain alpha-keto acid dehydrogenase subunit E2 n=1 Tax=Planobispora takensis TaxID=1367882 RepID=A0A8J3WS47_9ACTN|nr:acetoin dehydrogenase dihydrolipoyllysine-residue acetyltransferase subunit [Planobispora takensis]GII00160.1 branched-chain alpha-keto acid dehydrogenase subunit E2 [Planobispora takensis]